MADPTLNSMRVELLQQRRSIAMLAAQMPLSPETARALLDRCLQIAEAAGRQQ